MVVHSATIVEASRFISFGTYRRRERPTYTPVMTQTRAIGFLGGAGALCSDVAAGCVFAELGVVLVLTLLLLLVGAPTHDDADGPPGRQPRRVAPGP